jgi:hypothetical protein
MECPFVLLHTIEAATKHNKNIRIFGLLKNDGIGEVTFILFYKFAQK